METRRLIVPGATALVVAAFGWFATHRSTDPYARFNAERLGVIDGCAQHVVTDYAKVCVPIGWKIETTPADDPASSTEFAGPSFASPKGFRIHLRGATGIVAQLDLRAGNDMPQDIGDRLMAESDDSKRTSLIHRTLEAEALATLDVNAPGVGVSSISVSDQIPGGSSMSTMAGGRHVWLVVRGHKRFVLTATREDGDTAARAAEEILYSWAWTDGWADAEGAGPSPVKDVGSDD